MINKMKTALIILDGYAENKTASGNAIAVSGVKNITALKNKYPNGLLSCSGLAVGLPDGTMGNSEVGHLNLGAGRVVYQDMTGIDKSISDGSFKKNVAINAAIKNANDNNTALHFVGLLSDGGVHSTIKHLYALLDLAKEKNVKKIYVHALLDGRDVKPTSGADFLKALKQKLDSLGVGQVASVMGRYYFMDRDNRWERVKQGYDCMFDAIGKNSCCPYETLLESYKNNVTDEFFVPTVVDGYSGVNANDSIVFFNFRSDRAREISQAILYSDFDKFKKEKGHKPVFYVGFTQYDANFTGIHTAFPPRHLDNTLGEYLSKCGKKQVRIAETEKYAHVTFFFNGGVEKPNDNEQRILVPSPKVATYDLQPEMSANEVCEKTLEQINSGDADVIIVNFANCDMVGHTGILDAAVKAVNVVDICVGKIIDALLKVNGQAIITADHGNAEQMAFADGSVCTSHTTNDVPFIIVSNNIKSALKKGNLASVAPTLLKMMDLPVPKEMDGVPLI